MQNTEGPSFHASNTQKSKCMTYVIINILIIVFVIFYKKRLFLLNNGKRQNTYARQRGFN
jgi:hypothetical protein